MAKKTDRTALVLGGAKGIGLAIARRLAADGASVFLTGRNAEEVEAAASGLAGAVRGIVADAASPADLNRVMTEIHKGRGRIDALVLNAGIAEPASIQDTTPEHFDRHVAVNLRSAVFGVKAALPLMGPGGAIVLIGSVAGRSGTPGIGDYAATKAALRSYARTWTAEFAPKGIRVNVVSPGPTDTAMFRAAPDTVREAAIASIPLGRLGAPEDVAAAAAFLLSEEASFIAGAELCVDGGLTQV